MALAAVGVFVAYTGAADTTGEPIVVAARDIAAGHVIAASDVRLVEGTLPSRARQATFRSTSAVVGHVALAGIASDEIVQAGSLTTEAATLPGSEVALTLPRNQIAVGHLKRGELVDVYVTEEKRTTLVVRDAEVVSISADRDGSLTTAREVTITVSVPTRNAVATLVHALRTGEVTIVRSTFADRDEGSSPPDNTSDAPPSNEAPDGA